VVTPRANQIGDQFLSLVFACDLRESREVSRCVRQFLAAVPLPEDDLHAWELMVTEAANNAAEYVTDTGRQLSNRLEVFCRDDEIEIRLTDHTLGFDMPAQAELPSIDSEKGRGLFLIQSLADEVEYLRGRTENCMVIRKKRPVPAGSVRAGAATVAGVGSRFIADEQTLQTMTEELASCYESLSAIFRFSSALNRPQPTEEFAATWMRELLAIVEADWYVLRLVDPVGKELRLSATSLPDAFDYSLSLLPDAAAGSVELRAAQSRQDVWFDASAPLALGDPLSHVIRHSNGLAHPIFAEESLVGVLAVGRSSGDVPFKAGQVNVIQTFADFLGIQVSNARFRAEHLQAQLTARELQIASNLQRSLLPEKLPQMPGLGVAGYYHSARQVGGDFYDAIAVDGQGLLLVIADVMGKGVPAAMFATIFRSHLHARLDLVKRPGEFLTWLNRSLFSDLDRMEMFITAQLVYVDPAARKFQVAGAGHCPLLMTSDGNLPVEVGNTGFPLGIMADTRYSEELRDLPPGARLLLFTDGVTDTQNASDEMLGVEGLKRNLQQIVNQRGNAAQTVQDMAIMLQTFQGKEPVIDDQAFLVLASE
jgi:serine phosphatase RsbU (regulator of sigma subunit)/anti-sigma regulatory factor (Ser/Thr protein kinase)